MNEFHSPQTPTDHHATVEVLGMRPLLRRDIRVSAQTFGGRTCYVIEDPLSSKFYRLGIAEYTFVSLLDGKATVADAIAQTAQLCGEEGLNERECAGICKWLLDSNLATTDRSTTAGRLNAQRTKRTRQKMIGHLNPMIQKLPLFNPSSLLNRMDGLARICFGIPGIFVWCAVVIAGVTALTNHWQSFTQSSSTVLSSDNWLWLALTWFALKSIHELAHAFASQRFGVHVRESGIVLILLAPMPYVDVTQSWRLDNKWKRIFIAAAGMYAEIFCAAIAVLLWSWSFDPLIRQHAINVVITATVSTVAFNANPLMRFDGYYILTDLLENPNLATKGRRWFSYAMKHYLMGISLRCPVWSEGKHATVVCYAIAAMIWRLIVGVSLLLSAEVLFEGAGIVIAIAAATLWAAMAIYRTVQTMNDHHDVRVGRIATILCVGFLAAWIGWSAMPWYRRSTVPLVVDFHPRKEVRTAVSGFLDQCLVKPGDVVSQGQVLAKLSNPELELERTNLALHLEKSIAQYRNYLSRGAIAAANVEQDNQTSLRARLAQLDQSIANLTIRSPVDSIVQSGETESSEGLYFGRGDRLFVLGERNGETVIAMIEQRDVQAFRQAEGRSLDVRFWGTGLTAVPGTVHQVLPRASRSLPYRELAADAGGPLAIYQSAGEADPNAAPQLIQPRVPVLIAIQADVIREIRPGQTGYARLNYRDGTMGTAIWESIGNWIEQKRTLIRSAS